MCNTCKSTFNSAGDLSVTEWETYFIKTLSKWGMQSRLKDLVTLWNKGVRSNRIKYQIEALKNISNVEQGI